jgi:hypothetical protein
MQLALTRIRGTQGVRTRAEPHPWLCLLLPPASLFAPLMFAQVSANLTSRGGGGSCESFSVGRSSEAVFGDRAALTKRGIEGGYRERELR